MNIFVCVCVCMCMLVRVSVDEPANHSCPCPVSGAVTFLQWLDSVQGLTETFDHLSLPLTAD